MAEEPRTRTTEQKAQDYMAMGHSVELIDKIRADSDAGYKKDRTDEELKDIVTRHVGHLENMVSREDWGSEDMTASNAAIINGKAYIAS
tara:strand:+ start:1512 stop:1778 length:267 start_codon:yes stop_codon:yes gene_type:complete